MLMYIIECHAFYIVQTFSPKTIMKINNNNNKKRYLGLLSNSTLKAGNPNGLHVLGFLNNDSDKRDCVDNVVKKLIKPMRGESIY